MNSLRSRSQLMPFPKLRSWWNRIRLTGLRSIPALPARSLSIMVMAVSLFSLSFIVPRVQSQPVKSLENLMEIPEIRTISGSETHLYVLSGREGLVVFRATADSLQWLYSSSGLANRGDRLVTDIRFSYLFGRDGRLTVIEPTSVLGVYSSTRLEDDPNDVLRMGSDLYLADNDHGIRKLSLESSESVDRTPEPVIDHNHPVISLAGVSDRLYALDNDNRLLTFERDNGSLSRTGETELPSQTRRLHTIGNRLYLSTNDGYVHRVRSDGRVDQLFGIDEPVTELKLWNNNYLIRGESTRIWIARQGVRPTLFRDDASAGNHMTTIKDQLWISEYRELSHWIDRSQIAAFEESDPEDDTAVPTTQSPAADGPIQIASIDNQIIPYPRALLLPLTLESRHDIEQVRFQQKSNIEGIRIRGNGLHWQPSSSDVGSHMISVIATTRDGQTDSTSFQVTVRPFNSPPRFSPVRTLSIPANEEFSIPFQATDPDGSDSGLIRYIGVDLPDGASLDERSGEFVWTPTRRQTGRHEFQVIATDQYGAASSMDVTVEVVDLSREES